MSGLPFDQGFPNSTSADLSALCSNECGAILVRSARSADLPDLADLLAASFHTQDGILGWIYPLFRVGILEDLRTRFRSYSNHYVCLVAVKRSPDPEKDEKRSATSTAGALTKASLVGTVEMNLRHPHFWQVMGTRQMYISNLAVSKDYRRKKVAHQLLLTCERIALNQGFQDLYLHVLESNAPARRLYTKLGYQTKTVEWSPSAWILGQSQQLFLHKSLIP